MDKKQQALDGDKNILTYAQEIRAFDYSRSELELVGRCIPADGRIPGDYVGVVRRSDVTSIATMDGMGKGLFAFLHAHTVAQKYFIGAHRNGTEPTLEEMSEKFAKVSLSGKFFFSAFMLVEIRPDNNKEGWNNVTIYGMGQPAPLIYRNQQRMIEVLPRLKGVAIGVPRGDDKAPYAKVSTYLQPNDIMLLFSDGVSEARDKKGHMFGDTRIEGYKRRHSETNRLYDIKEAFLEHADRELDELVDGLIEETKIHCGIDPDDDEPKFQDDITFVAIRPRLNDE